jgi:hypothetical protein
MARRLVFVLAAAALASRATAAAAAPARATDIDCNLNGLCNATAGTCATDIDCNLNGLCNATAGTCACDAAWGGATCDTLNLLPAVRGQGNCDPSLNGTATGYTTTWGGLPQRDAATGTWHLHVAEMALHCGMCAWGSQSQVGHYASSAGLLGPYARVDTAVGPFAHNPVVVAAPPGTPGGVAWLMWHIGNGCASAGEHACNYTAMPTCTNGTTPPHAPRGSGPVANPPNLTVAATHVAASLEGPWTPPPAGWSLPACGNNPSPLFLANGSLMIMCHSPMRAGLECPLSGGLSFATSLTANWTHGPYGVRCLDLLNPNLTVGNVTYAAANEDPHLYADSRGHLHVLTHNQGPGYLNLTWFGGDVRGDGGHFFSDDGGETWRFTWHAAYSGLVQYTDGSAARFKRERPKVVQDPDTKALLALATGAGVELVDAFAPGDDAACSMVVAIATPTPAAAAAAAGGGRA